ncbi:MAG: hypothetical protein NDF54_10350 [archaeon GB-1867-035]|nr:hypothetical protein [Candidatus Culexmicrobium profundum]
MIEMDVVALIGLFILLIFGLVAFVTSGRTDIFGYVVIVLIILALLLKKDKDEIYDFRALK